MAETGNLTAVPAACQACIKVNEANPTLCLSSSSIGNTTAPAGGIPDSSDNASGGCTAAELASLVNSGTGGISAGCRQCVGANEADMAKCAIADAGTPSPMAASANISTAMTAVSMTFAGTPEEFAAKQVPLPLSFAEFP